MNNRRIIALILLMLFCSCESSDSSSETSVMVSGVTSSETISETNNETEIPIVFAKAETEIPTEETTVSETEETEGQETERVLADNQLEYSTKNIYILMEFTGVDELGYYPQAANHQLKYLEDDRVLHSNIQITNLSERSFDFIPSAIIIYGRLKNTSGCMSPVNKKDTGIKTADIFNIDPGETVSFDVDFVGDKICVESAYEIKYSASSTKAKEYNNTALGSFDITKRTAVKKAVSAALDIQKASEVTPAMLTPREGEYSVNTPKNSYCFTVEPVDDGRYIKVELRLQCLTGEPERFEPLRFRLTRKGDYHTSSHDWCFDELLTGTLPDVSQANISGVTGTLYNNPFYLSVRSDGSSECTMYFFTANDNVEDYYMFSYDGENDFFECIINIKT
ncbi:MAG: hypothetical protein J1E40_07705 [Oscillospiraceae bacterium]|nr:hypothetical protein [Oscillospiraceae bacterium]